MEKLIYNKYKRKILQFTAIIFIQLFLFFYVLKISVERYENISKIDSDLYNLKKKIELTKKISFFDIDNYIKIIDQVIPSFDNIFTIFDTLNDLSTKKGVVISNISFSDNNLKSKKIQLKFDISTDDIFGFLKNYHFITGRLITISDLKLNLTNYIHAININLYNFSSFRNFENDFKNINLKDLELLNQIKNQISANIFDNKIYQQKNINNEIDLYSPNVKTNENPFGL